MRKSVAVKGSWQTGHDNCPRVQLDEGSATVTAWGKPIGRVGDRFESHSCHDHGEHRGIIAEGCPYVTVNGLAVAVVGNRIDCDNNDAFIEDGEDRMTIGDELGEKARLDFLADWIRRGLADKEDL